MREDVFPTLIGIFILGALILALLAVAFYTTRSQLEQGETYVLYFHGSLKGLSRGSSVTYRGINVGRVTNINMKIDPTTQRITIPVFIKFYRAAAAKDVTPARLQAMVARGLRATLERDSLLSNNLSIALIWDPQTPIDYQSDPVTRKNYTELPTVRQSPTAIDFNKTIQVADNVLKNINTLVQSPEIPALLRSANQGAQNFSILTKRSTYAIDDFNQLLQPTMKNIDNLSYNLNDQLNPLLVRLDNVLSESKDMMYQIRVLVEYLSQQPSSVIVGKGKEKNHVKEWGKR